MPQNNTLEAIAHACGGAIRESDSQWSARCPAHTDRKPSLRIGTGDDGYPTLNCLAGCDYADVHAALMDLGLKRQRFRPPARQTGSAMQRGGSRKTSLVRPLPDDVSIAKWHELLLGANSEMTYLAEQRGLRRSTLMRHQVGWHYKRLTLPVRGIDGSVVNVRKYDRTSPKAKMTNIPGHGEAVLYPVQVLADEPDEPVLLCEGEWDALLAGQEGFVAVTGTGGAGTPPKDLEPLRDRSVFVVYDCDKAGRDGAKAIARKLLAVAKEVYVVDLALGAGEDITDWFTAYGRSDDDLRTLLESASPFVDEADYTNDSALYVTLADLERTPLEWVWAGRIPAGKLTMLEGDPGLGKSVLWAKIVAHVTTGEPLPSDGEVRPPSAVLVICAEDDLNDTILPRLQAAQADLTRVHAMRLKRDEAGHLVPLSIPESLPQLRKVIEQSGARLVVFDPVTAYLSETISSNNDASVRRALTPLAEIAQTTGAAVLLIRHLNKNGELKALYRGGGSIAFIGAARSGLIVDRHPEEEGTVVLAQTKSNLARGVPALTYVVGSWNEDATVPLVSWGEELDVTADELLKKPDAREEAPARNEAVAFLHDLLSDGPMGAGELRAAAKEAGVAWRTLERAKDRGAARTRRVRDAATGQTTRWEWFIPTVRIVRDEEEQ